MKSGNLKKLEYLLKQFYMKDKIIESYKISISRILDYIKEIDKENKEMKNLNLEGGYSALSFSEKVQVSNLNISYAEKATIEYATKLDKEKEKMIKEINRLEDYIKSIERISMIIERNINILDDESIKFIELKYKKNKTGCAISFELNISESGVTRLKKKVLEKFLQDDTLGKYINDKLSEIS